MLCGGEQRNIGIKSKRAREMAQWDESMPHMLEPLGLSTSQSLATTRNDPSSTTGMILQKKKDAGKTQPQAGSGVENRLVRSGVFL